MSDPTNLTPLELAIMKSLWRRGSAVVREVQADLLPERKLAYTTVMTVMDRLFKKGALRANEEIARPRLRTQFYRKPGKSPGGDRAHREFLWRFQNTVEPICGSEEGLSTRRVSAPKRSRFESDRRLAPIGLSAQLDISGHCCRVTVSNERLCMYPKRESGQKRNVY